MTAAAATSHLLQLLSLSFPGMGVQLSVFHCGQMELPQRPLHVRTPESLLFLPERRAQRAGGFALLKRGHREWNSKAEQIKPMVL